MRDPSLYNEDLAPVPAEKRTWTTWNITALWIGMAVCIPTYLLAAWLVDKGMTPLQGVATVAIGNLIVLAPLLLNAHPGTRYGIPFPVYARASFGVRGANIAAVARALVACGWFGIQTWIGGLAIAGVLTALGLFPLLDQPLLGAESGDLILAFVIFWLINLYFVHRGMESIRWLESLSAPVLLLGGLALLIWVWSKAGSLGALLERPAGKPVAEGAAFWKIFWPSLTEQVAFWSTLSLNIPDFSRYAKSQRAQIVGQSLGLPLTMVLFSFIGTVVSNGTGLQDPARVIMTLGSVPLIAISLVVLAIATLSTNIAANLVSPANDFSNLAPNRISFRLGGYITAGIALVMFPWTLLNEYQSWLLGYGALLGPIGGVLIVDYWIVRKRHLVVDDLYRRGGIYEYSNGINWVAVAAVAIGVLPNLPGFAVAVKLVDAASVPSLFVRLFDFALFVGFAVAGLVYYAGMLRSRPAQRG